MDMTAIPLLLALVRDEVLLAVHDAVANELEGRARERSVKFRLTKRKPKTKTKKSKRKPKAVKA